MRVFVAGATGVIGQFLVPVLVGGTGIWSFTEVTDAAAATVSA